MNIYVTDGSFEGLLCAIFTSYSGPIPTAIVDSTYQASLLDEIIPITTDTAIVERVIKGIDGVSEDRASQKCLKIFLSELDEANLLILRLVKNLMRHKHASYFSNYADPDVLRAAQIIKIMNREVHRMHAFVRFQKVADGSYYALVDPDFDVMPFLDDHFKRRFADMQWCIFDVRRQYGMRYNGQNISYIEELENVLDTNRAQLHEHALDDMEKAFQGLWQVYFDAVNIKARNNEKNHLRQLPKRYWKYLSEKQQFKKEELPNINLRGRS